MNLVLLSGESLYNKNWVEEVEKTLTDSFDQTKILYYNHWASGQKSIDLDTEMPKLAKLVEGLDGYTIFAKSIGAVLTLRGIYEKIISPRKCVFVGPAFLAGEKFLPDFPKWAQDFPVPCVVLTKSRDPVAPANQIRGLLTKYNFKNYSFVEMAGDDHHYDDMNKVKLLVREFLTS